MAPAPPDARGKPAPPLDPLHKPVCLCGKPNGVLEEVYECRPRGGLYSANVVLSIAKCGTEQKFVLRSRWPLFTELPRETVRKGSRAVS
jgi:hypothetical protein